MRREKLTVRSLVFTASVLVLVSCAAAADTIPAVPGEGHAGGTRIRFPSPVFFFTVPDGYMGTLSPGGDVFLLERAGNPGYVLIIAVPDSSAENMQLLLYQYLPYEGGIYLIPMKMPEIEGNRIIASYTAGAGEEAIKGRALAVVHEDGTAVAIFALGPGRSMEAYGEMLQEIADSLTFPPAE